jgi:hypothetical protein
MALVFDEVQFPVSISRGSVGGPTYSTDVVTLSSGVERRNQNWSQARLSYDVAPGVKNQTDLDALIVFFRARRGKARGFRFKDWLDYKGTGQAIGTIYKKSSTDITISSSGKTYTSAGAINFSTLAAGDSVYWTGCANAGNNGLKTVVSATATVLTVAEACTNEASGATVTILRTGPFQLVKNYTNGGTTEVRNIQKPVAGTTVVYFNGTSQPTWFTLDTTTGIFYLVGGTAAPTDGWAVTADYQFDVPVRFDVDEMQLQIVDIGTASGGVNSMIADWQKVPVIEVRLQ